MAPIIAMLLKQGLGLAANAVAVKGQEWLEEKTGVKLDLAKPEDLVKVKQFELENETELQRLQLEEGKLDLQVLQTVLATEAAVDEGTTKRWQADMSADSWLSKNIRPCVLLFLLVTYAGLAIASAAGYSVGKEYTELLSTWGGLVLTAYFGGRSAEKIMSMIQTRWSPK